MHEISIKVPHLGAGSDIITVSQVCVKEGQKVLAGDTVIEVGTGKSIFSIEAEQEGVISKIHVQEEQKIQEEAVVATLKIKEYLK